MPPSPPSGNVFLDTLPEPTLDALRPHLQPVPLLLNHSVYQADGAMDAVLFPTSGFVSVVADLADGETVEIGVVGRDGMTGASIALGQSTTTHRCTVQLAGEALSLPADVLRANLERDAALRAHVLRYVYATIVTISQTAACNRIHSVEERCANWLLRAHDRADGDSFYLTQEFLGQMLGVRRASVTLAASALQNAGLISYRRGTITILDRSVLDEFACECYAIIERGYRDVMGVSIAKGNVVRPRAADDEPAASPA